MLNDLHIQNFRLFRDFKIENLARVNLIVGKNNAGKSSLLDALYLLTNQLAPLVLLELLEHRGELVFDDDFYKEKGFDISHLFFGHELKEDISFQIESSNQSCPIIKAVYSKEKASITYGQTGKNGKNLFQVEAFNGLLDSHDANRLLRRTSAPYNSRYVTTQGLTYEEMSKLWDKITLTPTEQTINKMLAILDPKIERVNFQSHRLSNSGILIKRTIEDFPIPLGSFGEGTQRLLTLAIVLASIKDGYFLVDEIDTGLHYRVITDLWCLIFEIAEKLDIQVFATTHSWDCVRSFAEALEMYDNKEIAALFRLQKRGEDIHSVHYTAAELAFIISQNVQILEVR